MVAGVIPAHARDKPIELWWQDEARIGQQGTLTRVWAERGSRPRAPRDQRYNWAYLFGAVCSARDIGAALVLPIADTEMMNLHLIEISRHVRPGSQTVVLLDGGGWHQTGSKLKVPGNICVFDSYEASPTPAAMLGMHSPPSQAASNQSRHAHGHQLFSKDVCITPLPI